MYLRMEVILRNRICQNTKLEHIQSSDSIDDQSSDCTESPQREEWMILADYSTLCIISENETGKQHDWQSTTYPYISQEVPEMPSWINSKRKTFLVEPQTLRNPVDLDKLNNMQSLTYILVREHFDNPALHLPLHLIIMVMQEQGKAFSLML